MMTAKALPEGQPNRVRQILRRGLAAALPRRLFLINGSPRCRQICLTFDDGPHPEFTPPLLDALAKHQVRATFFVIGREAERFPDIVRRIVAEGHSVGNHTWSHRHPHSLSSSQLADEILKTNELLGRLTGDGRILFRPPHGKLTTRQLWKTLKSRQTIVLWSNDPKDYSRESPQELAAVFRSRPPQSGDIVLLHDNHPHAAAVLGDVIRDAESRELSFATPLDWLCTNRHAASNARSDV